MQVTCNACRKTHSVPPTQCVAIINALHEGSGHVVSHAGVERNGRVRVQIDALCVLEAAGLEEVYKARTRKNGKVTVETVAEPVEMSVRDAQTLGKGNLYALSQMVERDGG